MSRKIFTVSVLPEMKVEEAPVGHHPPSADEIALANMLLKDSPNGTLLPHHFRENILEYKAEPDGIPIRLTHTYCNIDGTIYAKLHRADTIGEGKFGKVKRLMNVETGEIFAIKLLNHTTNSDQSSPENADSPLDISDFTSVITTGTRAVNAFKKMERTDFGNLFSLGYTEVSDDENPEEHSTDQATVSTNIELQWADITLHYQKPDDELLSISPKKEDKTFQLLKFGEMNLATYTNTLKIAAANQNVITFLERIEFLFSSLIQALDDLHKGKLSKTHTKYIHTDIKPQNILVNTTSKPHIVLCDLDSCLRMLDKESRSSKTSFLRGSPGYLAPELPQDIKNAGTGASYSIASDTYALGKTLSNIINTVFAAQSWNDYRTTLLKLCSLMQCDNPDIRPPLSVMKLAFEEAHKEFIADQSHKILAVQMVTSILTPENLKGLIQKNVTDETTEGILEFSHSHELSTETTYMDTVCFVFEKWHEADKALSGESQEMHTSALFQLNDRISKANKAQAKAIIETIEEERLRNPKFFEQRTTLETLKSKIELIVTPKPTRGTEENAP